AAGVGAVAAGSGIGIGGGADGSTTKPAGGDWASEMPNEMPRAAPTPSIETRIRPWLPNDRAMSISSQAPGPLGSPVCLASHLLETDAFARRTGALHIPLSACATLRMNPILSKSPDSPCETIRMPLAPVDDSSRFRAATVQPPDFAFNVGYRLGLQ